MHSRSVTDALDDSDNGDAQAEQAKVRPLLLRPVPHASSLSAEKLVNLKHQGSKTKDTQGRARFLILLSDMVTALRLNQMSKTKISTVSSNTTSKPSLEPLSLLIPLLPRDPGSTQLQGFN